MAKYTAGEIADKISELRSKVAVQETLISQLRANYMSSDAGAGELRIQRQDGAVVPDHHFQVCIKDMDTMINELRGELEEWESLTFNTGPVEVEVEEEDDEVEEPVAISKKKEKRNVPAKRPNQHQAAAK